MRPETPDSTAPAGGGATPSLWIVLDPSGMPQHQTCRLSHDEAMHACFGRRERDRYPRDWWQHNLDAGWTCREITLPPSGAGAAGLDEVERPDPWVDTRLVRFDPSVHFGQSYDGFDNFDKYRWEMHVPGAGSYAVWSNNDTGKHKRWSFYGGPDGVLSFERYATEADARRDAEDYALSIKTSGDMRLAQRDATLARQAADLERLRAADVPQRTALERIERWFGEFPKTGRYWDDRKPKNTDNEMSYAACFGSNGERDFMRGIARDALALAPDRGSRGRPEGGGEGGGTP